MKDEELVARYCSGDRRAEALTKDKYSVSCRELAYQILGNYDEADSVVQEVFSLADRLIPEKVPNNLQIFLWRATRNLSLLRDCASEARNQVISEMNDWLPCAPPPECSLSKKELFNLTNEFLSTLPALDRKILIAHFWHFLSISAIAHCFNLSEEKVYSILGMTGSRFQQYLESHNLNSVEPAMFLQAFGYIRETWITELPVSSASSGSRKKWAVIAGCLCCITFLGFAIFRHLLSDDTPPAPVLPTISTATTNPSSLPGIGESSNPAPPDNETEANPAGSATEPSVSIHETEVYQKIMQAEKPHEVKETVMEAFAQWIIDENNADDFLNTYDGEWMMKRDTPLTSFTLHCSGAVDEEHKQKYTVLRYEDGEVELWVQTEIQYTDVPREEISELVYGARDEIGVPDEVKEEFIDFILYSDWFAWSTINPDQKTEWFFDMARVGKDSDEKYITLFVKILDDDPNVTSYKLCTLYYNDTKVMDGMRDSPIILPE